MKLHFLLIATATVVATAFVADRNLIAAKSHNPSAQISFQDPLNQDQIYGDDNGAAYVDNQQGVQCFFVANGNVTLITGNTRHLYLGFSTPDTALNSELSPPPSGYYDVNMTQGVENPDGSCCTATGLLGMPAGTSAPSWLSLSFNDSTGHSWIVRFAHSNDANTSDVTATNTSATTWTITATPADVAVLIEEGKKGNTIAGYYFMPVQMTITQ
jgi:hypothetical protein